MRLLFATLIAFTLHASAQQGTRGIGVYPGAPSEYFGPQAVEAPRTGALRNLALHRKATASSSIDYNLTAHLVTDGICDTLPPSVLTVATPQGRLTRREAEWAIDGGPYSRQTLLGDDTWMRFDWGGRQTVTARKVVLDARMAYRDELATEGYVIACQTSADGNTWTTVAQVSGDSLPGKALRHKMHSDPNKQTDGDLLPARRLDVELTFDVPRTFSHMRLLLRMKGAAHWAIHDIHFIGVDDRQVWPLSSATFTSMWMSDGGGRQWLSIDLGAPSEIDHITPHWHHEPRRWHAETSADGRHVTLDMDEPDASGVYALREVEVWGRNSLSLRPADLKGWDGRRFELSGGAWRLQRASQVGADGLAIASEGFAPDDGWIVATVPGTVLTSYINADAVPNPNVADMAEQISESFFNDNFWYRTEFDLPAHLIAGHSTLHFDGVNWKARVFLNGHLAGHVDGAFCRGQLDVSRLLHEGRNCLAVEVVRNEHFGVVKEKDSLTTQFNGGMLGADNPTFHASIGWDWITTVRGREAGIWNEVYLTFDDGVTLSDPYVQTRLQGDVRRITPSVFVANHRHQPVSGVLSGWIGDVVFERRLTLPARHETEVVFSPDDHPQLSSPRFRLWWPNGYGPAHLYDAGFTFTPIDSTHTAHAARLDYKAGLRQMSCIQADDSLRIYVNGRRFVPLGGNWGFDEHNLCYRSREYQAAVAYHRDMHCTMIRNWVGQTGDEAFYEACDSMGIMVWQDFWLANPADGPDPHDHDMFADNARDYVRRMRRHPSIGIYCGRNEGFPPADIDSCLRRCVDTLSPGLTYISSSADGGVTGHGPYSVQTARDYFALQTGKLHTERGMPAPMNIESLRRTLSPQALWPQNQQWGKHDYVLQGAQRAQTFNDMMARRTGLPADAEQFSRWAQLPAYDGYRAMFESAATRRMGLLIWMSHPCWPTMVWQTYDYYLDPTAAYFGVKKACEPLHIQLNALTGSVEVVNLFAPSATGLQATATAYDMQGHTLWSHSARTDSPTDSTTPLFAADTTAVAGTTLLRLTLSGKDGIISHNDYILSGPHPISAGPTTVSHSVDMLSVGDGTCRARLTLWCDGPTAALMVRVNLTGDDGQQILPVIYSDNYFNLLPGQRHTVDIEWHQRDARGCRPVFDVTTLNPVPCPPLPETQERQSKQ